MGLNDTSIHFQSIAIMFPPLHPISFLRASLACLLCSPVAIAQDVLDHLRNTGEAEVAIVVGEGKLNRMDLARKYVAALENLEKSLTASGQLDSIIHLREEQESVRKTGDPTTHEDKSLVELRAKYLKSLEGIDANTKASRAKVVGGLRLKIREQETTLTKAGKVADALKLRKEGEELLSQLSGGATVDSVAFADDPRVAATADVKPLQPIEVPKETPAPYDKPFAIEDRWLESMTIPLARQRIREPIIIGDRGKKKWPLIVVSPGSVWAGDGSGRIELSAANFVAARCRFQTLELGSDHACRYFFQNCAFDDCKFPRNGIWWGGDLAAKFFFENCYIKGNYSGKLAAGDNGIRAQTCVFENVEFPTMHFQKHQPADFVNERWLRIINSRFVKSKLPLSFLLLTRDCVFENCIFMEDKDRGDDVEITKPIQIDMYVSNCQMKINKLPPAVTLSQKPIGELKGIAIPTATLLTEMMAK